MSKICEEADGAVDYAQKAVYFASRPNFHKMYAEMAEDELKHARYLMEIGKTMINEEETSGDISKAWLRCVKHVNDQIVAVSLLLKDEAGAT